MSAKEAVLTTDGSPGPDDDVRRLVITIGPDIAAPTPGHSLLAAFRFSADSSRDTREEVVTPGPELIQGDEQFECWWYRGNVQRRKTGDIRVFECDDYAFVVLQREDVPADRFRAYAHDAYCDLLKEVGAIPHGNLVKIWNYFPGINIGEGDAEKYRQFSIGRADAFEEVGIFDDRMPAGTAVGSSGSNLSIIALVSTHDFVPAENPRQVSAYKYPRQYGPRSPKFSRGGCIATQDHRLSVLSGTASIIGHESMHPYETQPQVEETIENLNCLMTAMLSPYGDPGRLVFNTESFLRVYVRESSDVDSVAEELQKQFGAFAANVVFLRSDICRRELMVEVDGVFCF